MPLRPRGVHPAAGCWSGPPRRPPVVLLSATSLAPGFPLPRTVSVPSVFLAGSYLDRRIDENEEYRTPSGSPQVA